ncbi:MAG: VCBS domain-containing protein [Alphaproteobacteria bacterium]
MTNHAPVFTTGSQNVSFTETANTTGSGSLHTLTGTLNFTDSDHTDTHTTSAALKSVVWSGGSGVPSTTLSDLATAMSSTITTDHNGSGSVKWTFSDPDKDFDFLAKNETLVISYDVSVNDNHGGSTKQTVKVTVTGTDDKPVINMETVTVLTEQPNHTLSLTPDTAHIQLTFSDPDLDNTNYTATVTGVTASGSTAGLLPGSLGTAELMAFYNVDNVSKPAGQSNGTVNTTFSGTDLAFDYLAAGEQLNITYTVQLDDHAGGLSTQTVTVTILGTNDKPVVLAFPESAHLTEGQNLSGGNLTAHGDFLFSDIDLSDTHTVSTTVTATRSGGGAVPLSNADLVAAMSTSVADSTGHLLGDVGWNFALSNSAVGFLSGGETLTLNYHLAVTDPSGGSDTEDVTITILGTNHPVVITSGPESASVAEADATTGSPAPDVAPPGSLAFTDPDTSDTHTVHVSVGSEVWSGGGSVPATTHSDLATALATTLNDSTGTGNGSVDWSFGIPDRDLDFLAAGETLTVTYNVQVADATTSATQTVTITATGANDAVVMTSGPESASLTERPDTNGSTELDTTSPVPTGTLSFTDVDLSDVHSTSVVLSSAVLSTEGDISPPFELTNALQTTLNDSTGTGTGGVDWTFAVEDRVLDFIPDGVTLTLTYDVTVGDAATSSTQSVTITITGTADPLTVNPVSAVATDTLFHDEGNIVLGGNVIFDGGSNGGDAGTTLSVTEVNGSAADVGAAIAGTYGSVVIFGDGTYQYTANSSFDALQVGDNPADQFTFTITDNLGRTDSATLTVNVVGADDAPSIVAADTSASITEDAGPTVLVNGGFESGDLTGWTTSGSHISAEFLGLGGEFGNYAAKLAPTAAFETLSQDVATVAGQHYELDFYVSGDSESSSNSMTVTWDGTTVLALGTQFGGLTHYSFDVVATDASSTLAFTYADDGVGMFVDQVNVNPATGPATESASGSIAFSDVETADTHTASFIPQSGDYVGTFSLDPVSEASGSGSVGWHFAVDNADIQFLAQNQTVLQTYTVLVTDDQGVNVSQDVTVALHGTNDAPTTVGADNVITDADVNGGVFLPGWALTHNDTDPDLTDVLSVNSITGTSGLDAFLLGGVIAFDDTTLGGSFTYSTTDGMAVSPGSGTVTVTNSAPVATLSGTGGSDILVAVNGNEALNGGGGNDILIGNSGTHTLTGGSGDDIFAFQVVPDQTPTPANTITDFNNVSDHDMIAISAAAFGAGLTPGQDTSGIFESTGDADFIGSLFHYDTANQTLYFSSDGTNASAIVVTQLQSGVLLNSHDLMIV